MKICKFFSSSKKEFETLDTKVLQLLRQMSSWITWPHPTPCDQWPPVLAYEEPWGTSAVGSSGIAEVGEADIGIATSEASGKFLEESGSKPRVLR